MAKKASALDLLEIRLHLAQFLDMAQLTAVVAVCKSWSATFSPFLFSHIHWSNSNQENNMSLSAIQANKDMFQSLQLNSHSLETILKVSFTKLTRIHVAASCWDYPLCDSLSRLIIENIELRLIQINVGELANPHQLMEALSSCLNLKTLSLACLSLDHQTTQLLFQICTHLEDMDFSYISMPSDWELDQDLKFPKMKTLRLGTVDGFHLHQQLLLIRNCSCLKSLRWGIDEDVIFPYPELCKILVEDCLDLSELHFEEEFDLPIPDEDLARIFDSFTILTNFSAPRTMFGKNAFQSLQQHFNHLVNLQVRSSPMMTSPMVQVIMMSCPQLVVFFATYLDARDILGVDSEEEQTGVVGRNTAKDLDSRDWVCLKLKELRLHICGLEGKPEWQRPVLTQLARLTRLEWVNFSCVEWGSEVRDGLDLRLSAGLDILGKLKRIESLMFLGLKQEMDEQEVRWMMQRWPRLANLFGNIHFNKARRLELEIILREKDINLFDFGSSND
ncbi:hypothetical protein BGZ49_003449 [Haplosporangium sp. Z 27]|nr:hypothetical protein BGZ49_003449 [Haplosporangium sp. Z 27]